MYLVTSHKAEKRKTTRNRQHYRQRLPCPACEFERLIDTGQYTHSLTYLPGEDGYVEADYYQKCRHCKADIGIRKIE